MLVSHPKIDTCSLGPCWVKEEHTESAHVPLMIGTVVSPDLETPVFANSSASCVPADGSGNMSSARLTSNPDLALGLLAVASPLKFLWNRSPLLLSRA